METLRTRLKVVVGSVTGTLLDGHSLDARHEVVVGSVTGTLLDGDSLDTIP